MQQHAGVSLFLTATSSFFGIGKKSVFKVLKETADYFRQIEKFRQG
jgi:hypothetical protein